VIFGSKVAASETSWRKRYRQDFVQQLRFCESSTKGKPCNAWTEWHVRHSSLKRGACRSSKQDTERLQYNERSVSKFTLELWTMRRLKHSERQYHRKQYVVTKGAAANPQSPTHLSYTVQLF
jgi:hypothetical protein